MPTSQPADAACIETDDLGAAGLTGEQFGALISGAGRAGMREWLERLAPALRAIFVLRAVAGQDGEQTAESLRQSGAKGAQAWRRDQVGTAYRQALCSLATCLMSAQYRAHAGLSRSDRSHTPDFGAGCLTTPSVIPGFCHETGAFGIAGGPSF